MRAYAGDIRQSPEDMVASLQRPHVGALTDWTAISSVYFDDSDFQTYTLRMKREDGASVVRVRWYGQRSMSGSQELFLERKVHREPWTGERSFKVATFACLSNAARPTCMLLTQALKLSRWKCSLCHTQHLAAMRH